MIRMLPNLLTLARIILVVPTAWYLWQQQMAAALMLMLRRFGRGLDQPLYPLRSLTIPLALHAFSNCNKPFSAPGQCSKNHRKTTG